MLNVILYPWSDCAIYSGHFIEISTEVEKSHWHHVVSVTLTSKRCNFKIKPQICISTWVLLNIKCFGCPWIFFWGIHGWHDVSVTCCQHEFVSKGCFKLNHLLVHVSIHNNNWSKCLLKLKRPIWKIWCQCDALYQKFANCPAGHSFLCRKKIMQRTALQLRYFNENIIFIYCLIPKLHLGILSWWWRPDQCGWSMVLWSWRQGEWRGWV